MRSRSPRTSVKMGHKHSYIVDASGNGRTSRECHPLNPTICHSHEIRNYVVQHQASATKTVDGFGQPSNGYANESIYTTVEIYKES